VELGGELLETQSGDLRKFTLAAAFEETRYHGVALRRAPRRRSARIRP